jgi:zinc protease
MKRICTSAAALLLCAISHTSIAGTAADTKLSEHQDIPPRQFTLTNGLRVVLWPTRQAPVIAVAVVYNTGSRNEVMGKTGYAHLFEHMMFQGSQNVGRGEHMALIQENGGGMNGETNEEVTQYYEALPSNQLDLALFLESDRMRGLNLTQASLDNQRSTVQEERRLRVDNRPYGATDEEVDELSHDAFAYRHPVIGSMTDLNAATLGDIKDFFTTYYAPDNAVLAVSGDFDEKTIRTKIEKYFGSVPNQPPPPPVNVAEPPITEARTKTMTDSFATQPMVTVAYRTVPANTQTWYALEVASSVLGDGQSSRLYTQLVKEKQLATSVYCNLDESRGSSLFYVKVILRKEASMKAVEDAISEEIAGLQSDPPKAWEIEKARNGALMHEALMKQTALGRATTMAVSEAMFGDPTIDFLSADRVSRIDPAEVVKATMQYLKPNGRVVVETQVNDPKMPAPQQKESN